MWSGTAASEQSLDKCCMGKVHWIGMRSIAWGDLWDSWEFFFFFLWEFLLGVVLSRLWDCMDDGKGVLMI